MPLTMPMPPAVVCRADEFERDAERIKRRAAFFADKINNASTGRVFGSVLRESPREAALRRMSYIETELCHRYDLIGQGNGPYATPLGREGEHRFWMQVDPHGGGAWWLIKQIDAPCGVEYLWGIGGVLAAIAPVSIDPILSTLEGAPSNEQADVLLSALAGIDPVRLATSGKRIESIVRRYISHRDDAVRLQAVGATAVLAQPIAFGLLREALAHETDSDVRAALEDALEQRSH